jgi:peptidoglycan/LPS O-acetylase OafA/YrhL
LLCVFPPRVDAVTTVLRYLTLTQNLISDMPADYYFVVTWSLTIEEWFYLLFGALVIMSSRRMGGRRALPWCLAMFMLLPLALRLWYGERGALVILLIDENAYGVLMARLYVDGSRLFRWPLLTLAAGVSLLAVALGGVLPLPERWAVPMTSNLEVAGGALCLPAALLLSRAAWWIERPVRWLAARSYALYLMHLTILVDVVEVRVLEAGWMPAAGCVVLAVVAPFPLAALSYRWLEAPLLRLRPGQGGLVQPSQKALQPVMA